MYSRWFNLTVFFLWLTMMTWLVTQKVLPSLLIGNPPSYTEILKAQENHPTVGWTMLCDHDPIGWAISTTTPLPHGLTEINSRIHFRELPVGKMTPDWLRAILQPIGHTRSQLAMDAVSTLVFDPLGRLSRFVSAIRFEPNVDIVKITGAIDGGTLSLTVRAGDLTVDKELPLPGSAMLGDAVSPQSNLPGLRDGQTWTVEVYSPFLPPNTPMEILEAKVEGKEHLQWEGRFVETWLVVYRRDPGARGTRADQTRGRVWVRRDGTVLQQEVKLFHATLTLVRLSDDAAAVLAQEVANAERRKYDSWSGTSDREPVRNE